MLTGLPDRAHGHVPGRSSGHSRRGPRASVSTRSSTATNPATCPWCLLSPVCPCRRGGGPHGFTPPIGSALVAIPRRLGHGRRPIHPAASARRRTRDAMADGAPRTVAASPEPSRRPQLDELCRASARFARLPEANAISPRLLGQPAACRADGRTSRIDHHTSVEGVGAERLPAWSTARTAELNDPR